MSSAKKCDVCGALVPALLAIEIVGIRVPYRTTKGDIYYRGWGGDGEELDVCHDCLTSRHLGETFGQMCTGFAKAVDVARQHEESEG